MTSGIGKVPHKASAATPRDWTASPALQLVLGVPLPAKLVGANLLVVIVAAVVAFNIRSPDADWSVLLVAAVALAAALAINVLLVSFAIKPLRELERTAWRVWAGNLESRVPPSRIADAGLRRVSSTLNYLLGALAEDRARARSLASAVVKAGDKERARIGHELHDSIAQSVAALRYQLVAIEQEVGEPQIVERLRTLRADAGELLEEIKLLSLSTHPRILDDLGLVPALRHLSRALNVPLAISVSVTGDVERELGAIPRHVAAALYGIAREAIANAIQHASADRIDITIKLADGGMAMQIDDDGTGFDLVAVEASQPTAGLFAMRERTALADGTFEIVSASRQGTSVRVRIPAGSSMPAMSLTGVAM